MNDFVQITVYRVMVCCIAMGFSTTGIVASKDQNSSENIQLSRHIALSDLPNVVSLSGDGRTIVVASGRVLIAIDATSGEQLRRWELSSDVVDIALSKKGQLIAVANDTSTIDVYNVASGEKSQQLHRKDAPHFLRQDGQQRMAFYPDGTKLTSTGTRKRIYVSDVKTGDWDHIMFVKYDLSTPVVSPNGRHIALIGSPDSYELSGQVTMYKIRRGLQPLWTKWHKSKEAVTHAVFSPQSSRLATTGAGDGVRVWDVESGEQHAHIVDNSINRLFGVSFVEDGRHLLTVSPQGFRLRKADGGEVLASVKVAGLKSLRGFASSHDGSIVVTFTNEEAIDVWRVRAPRVE